MCEDGVNSGGVFVCQCRERRLCRLRDLASSLWSECCVCVETKRTPGVQIVGGVSTITEDTQDTGLLKCWLFVNVGCSS